MVERKPLGTWTECTLYDLNTKSFTVLKTVLQQCRACSLFSILFLHIKGFKIHHIHAVLAVGNIHIGLIEMCGILKKCISNFDFVKKRLHENTMKNTVGIVILIKLVRSSLNQILAVLRLFCVRNFQISHNVPLLTPVRHRPSRCISLCVR